MRRALFALGVTACVNPCAPVAPPGIAVLPADLPPTARREVWQAMAEDDVAPRHPSDGGGRWALVEGPPVVPRVGDLARYVLRYTAGPEGVARGGALVFQAPAFWGWSPAQVRDPGAPGFLHVETAADGVTLVPEETGDGSVRVTVEGRGLRSGEAVTWVYGEGVGAIVDRYAERGQVLALAVDGDGDGVRAWVADLPRVDVRAGPAVGLWVTTPTTGRPGEQVRLTVAALDARANVTAELPTSEVALVVEGPAVAPAVVTLGGSGTAVVPLTLVDTGVVTVRALGGEGLGGTSEPLVVHPDAPAVLWADLQVHTGASDGTGARDDVYAYARDVAGLDVVALTDHDHWGIGFLDRSPGAWAETVAAADRWYAPGQFVTFSAYEWTSWLYGHRHVLYVGPAGPVYGSLDPPTRTPAGLAAALAPHDALVITHHTAGGPVAVDWRTPPDPRLEPVTEVVSVHGVSEAPDAPGRIYDFREGTTALDALRRGYRLGFVGSTDGHDGHPGLAHLQAPSGGLAALVTSDRTREGVAAALRARRTYATDGVRLLLRVWLDGEEMGGAVAATGAPSEVEVRVVAGRPVATLEVLVSGAVVHRATPGLSALRERVTIGPLAEGAWVTVRLFLEGGGAAWSSPVWVDPGGS